MAMGKYRFERDLNLHLRDAGRPIYIYIYIYIILINNSRRKDKGNQWHDGGCISDTKFC